MSRKLLDAKEHRWIVCIRNLTSCTDWDRIKQDLLPAEVTRCCILVTTKYRSVARYCVDHDESRALDAKDLLRGFPPQDHHGQIHYVREDNIQEKDKFKPGRLVGREDEVRGYRTLPHVPMSYWGIAGVGKSAVVREIYNEQKTSALNYQTFGWVDVPYPFNLEDLCRRLLLDFYSDEAKEAVAIAMMEGQDPTHWCSQILHQGIVLIVFDGLQSKHDWDLIKTTLLSEPIIGTTIVITREESIATHCATDEKYVVNIKGLGDYEALDLFIKIALDGEQLSLPPHAAQILNLIISKCGGLPEIITAIADECDRTDLLDDQVLEGINNDFIGILERMPGLRGLFCWMQSYFDGCSDELKPCIFYISVFPVDQIIRRRRLLRRWIAEGYSSGAGGGTTEEKGEKLLSELMKLSIIYQEDQETSTIKGCKVNGFFGAYIKSRPMEDNLVFALEGSCSPSSRLTGQHLTISSSWDRDETVFNSIDLSRLRSLTVFGGWKSFLASEKMKVLRVLDLEGTNALDDSTCVTDDHLEEIGKLLHRLKFLSLRGCQQITRLPDSLGDMRQLETLDARYTSIVELPPAIITKLHKLQYIRAGKTVPSPTSTPTSPPLTPTAPQEDSHGGTSPSLRAAAHVARGASSSITQACKRKAQDFVKSSHNRWRKLKNLQDMRRRHRVAANGGGVEIGHVAAEGIGRLTGMHTLGVVNVAGGKGALLFLEEVKKLTQLRKLGLCGINRDNWPRFCDAISGNLRHLESLSLELMLLEEEGGSFDFACFHNIAKPPKTLESLKVLYATTGNGVASIRPVWLKKLPKVKSLDHELTISSQEDIRDLADTLSKVCEVRIKPIEEHLSFEKQDENTYTSFLFSVLPALMIECSDTLSHSKVTFGELLCFFIQAISIRCCCSSSAAGTSAGSCNLKIAKLDQLSDLCKVTVTGTYADGLKRDLREQVHNHPKKPVLE